VVAAAVVAVATNTVAALLAGRREDERARGQSLVELALALPALLLVLVAVVQLALVVHAQNVMTAAAQEGARYGAAEGRTATEGATRAQEVLASGVGGEDGTFTVSARGTGDLVVVQVQGRYRLLVPWLTGRTLPLEATAEMRREGFRAGP
jgi:Flp pilus assembly protein TadG